MTSRKSLLKGCITLALIAEKTLLTPEALGIDSADYPDGSGQSMGELKIYIRQLA